jgi:hypothetical protein
VSALRAIRRTRLQPARLRKLARLDSARARDVAATRWCEAVKAEELRLRAAPDDEAEQSFSEWLAAHPYEGFVDRAFEEILRERIADDGSFIPPDGWRKPCR